MCREAKTIFPLESFAGSLSIHNLNLCNASWVFGGNEENAVYPTTLLQNIMEKHVYRHLQFK